MDILKAIYSSSDYLPVLQAQALGTADAHIVLRNSPVFFFFAAERRGSPSTTRAVCGQRAVIPSYPWAADKVPMEGSLTCAQIQTAALPARLALGGWAHPCGPRAGLVTTSRGGGDVTPDGRQVPQTFPLGSQTWPRVCRGTSAVHWRQFCGPMGNRQRDIGTLMYSYTHTHFVLLRCSLVHSTCSAVSHHHRKRGST